MSYLQFGKLPVFSGVVGELTVGNWNTYEILSGWLPAVYKSVQDLVSACAIYSQAENGPEATLRNISGSLDRNLEKHR